VRLTSFLAGELGREALTRDLELTERASLEKRYGCAVVAIARRAARGGGCAPRLNVFRRSFGLFAACSAF
jgi:hypothetical protein